MVSSLCLCLLVGFLLGTRYQVYILLPAGVAAMLLGWRVGVAADLAWFALAGWLVLFPTVLQAGYGAALMIQLRLGSPQRLGLRNS